MRALLLGLLLVAACGDEETFLVVTVDSRPAVHDARSLSVTLSNAGSMYTQELQIDNATFPMTFSVSAPNRTGELGISIDALDAMGTLVGRGSTQTRLDQEIASVTLDSADFVVNSERINDQFLTTDFEAVGFQLAGISNGQWMAVYRDECMQCSIFGRRFDSTGLAVFSELAAGDIAFSVNESLTTTSAMPAVAASGLMTLAFWDFTATTGGARGVACRAINEQGAATTSQTAFTSDPADVVSATGLPNRNFAVVWQMYDTNYVIRAAIVKPDCTLLGNVVTASTDSGSLGAKRAHVAANGQTVLYTWIVDGNLRIRTSDLAGVFQGTEVTAVPGNSASKVEHARVTPWQDGFAVAVRWASTMTDGPGKIEVYRANAAGVLDPSPILITENSRSDFASKKGFSIAARADGALLVVWHVCETGPGLCDVYGRILRPTGAPVGPEFMVPTATASDQINPSVIALDDAFVAAWNDSSGEAPDRSGTAVRARILYPTYDDARGVHGATCGASAPGAPDCDDGLACAMGSDGVQRCYAICTPPSCPAGGTCTPAGSVNACTF